MNNGLQTNECNLIRRVSTAYIVWVGSISYIAMPLYCLNIRESNHDSSINKEN